jgi:hypothetical protein
MSSALAFYTAAATDFGSMRASSNLHSVSTAARISCGGRGLVPGSLVLAASLHDSQYDTGSANEQGMLRACWFHARGPDRASPPGSLAFSPAAHHFCISLGLHDDRRLQAPTGRGTITRKRVNSGNRSLYLRHTELRSYYVSMVRFCWKLLIQTTP